MAILEDATVERLLASIHADRLIVLCGAGLSMPAPSSLMSAVRVAETCYDSYDPIKTLPAPMRSDPDALAGYFYDQNQFESVFLAKLVPWDDLVGRPNSGHAAIAELLATRAMCAAISTNFDCLIEQYGNENKLDLQGALDGQEAVAPRGCNPLLKLHGCMVRDRSRTIWSTQQLGNADIAQRLSASTAWLKLQLPGKDLLIVGFWTDWAYLNAILRNAVGSATVTSVTVVDVLSRSGLEAKAPELWAALTGLSGSFEHIQGSGGEALEELLAAFARAWLREFYAHGKPLFEKRGVDAPDHGLDRVSLPDLCSMRRDAEGVPYGRMVRTKGADPSTAQTALAHLCLLAAGAVRRGSWYEFLGKTMRVVHGAGKEIETVRNRYVENPALAGADVVICAGAMRAGVPGRIVPSGAGASTVRPAPGGSSEWLTFDEASARFAL